VGGITGGAAVLVLAAAGVLVILFGRELFHLTLGLVLLFAAAFLGIDLLQAYATGRRDRPDLETVYQLAGEAVRQNLSDSEDAAPIHDRVLFEGEDRRRRLVRFFALTGFASTIAALGVLLDSTAVVIGAMLIAPLMTPIMGTAAAIVNGWRGRMLGSLSLVGISVAAAIVVAWAIATWIPALVPPSQNSQILSRTSPTLVDMAIALAAGAAGAYATVDDRVSSSLPGVAIAVALVPPLGVVGVTLQAGLGDDARGAFLLFFTNFVSIILASVVVFMLTGFSPIRTFLEKRATTINVLSTVVVGALLIMIPLGLTGASIINSATSQQTAQRVSNDWIEQSPNLDLETVKASGNTVDLNVTGTGDLPSVEQLEQDLSSEMGRPITVTVEYFETVQITYSEEGGLVTSESSTPASDGG
jgi:uncharacterized hydrophobic protein (TIGR00271 family)